jgi:hypothetical protein
VVDLAGHKTVLSTGWADLTGLAWSPRGNEVWFTGDRNSGSAGLFAVTLESHEREVGRIPGDLVLFDVGQDGRALLAHENWRSEIYGSAPGQSRERDLSWFDFSVAGDLSADGKTLVFWEVGESVGALVASAYLRSTDGSPAVRLSDGNCWALSRDARKVICSWLPDRQLNQVPTRTGEVKQITHDQLTHTYPQWLPDETRIVFLGQEPGHGGRFYVQDLEGGQPRPITPEGASSYAGLSHDGSLIAVAMGAEYKTVVYPVNGGEGRPVSGLEPGEIPVVWSDDNRSLYCYHLGGSPVDIFRVELASGRRTPWKQLVPPDPIGVTWVGGIFFSSDMKSYVYTVQRRLNILYLVEGLH